MTGKSSNITIFAMHFSEASAVCAILNIIVIEPIKGADRSESRAWHGSEWMKV
jgi:hypothetical protein